MTELANNPAASERIVCKSDADTIALLQLVPEDAPNYFELVDYDRSHLSQFGDVTAQKYVTPESVAESIRQADPNRLRFGIWDEENMVGSINLTRLPDERYEIGWWVGKNHTGHKYAQRAARILIDYAFTALRVGEVVAFIKEGNEASRKTAEGAGLQLESDDGHEWVYSADAPKVSQA